MIDRRIWTATAIFACLAVFLCACGKDADVASTTDDLTVSSPWSEAQVFTLPAETTTVQSGKKDKKTEKTDTQAILSRIETARQVYGLFSESRPQLDKSDSVEIESGLFAYRVTDPKLDTLEKLQAYVSGYFSESITQQLLNVGIYVQRDDKLYALDVGMQMMMSGDKQVKVTSKTETSEHYRLTIRSDTETKTFDYDYEKQESGKWVFTHFEAY